MLKTVQRSVKRESLNVKRFGGNAFDNPRFTFHTLPFTVFESILLVPSDMPMQIDLSHVYS
jgi:hypothetical protein